MIQRQLGRLTNVAIEVRNGISYEKSTFVSEQGEINIREKKVTKADYQAVIDTLSARINSLVTLQDQCIE